jgi:hypothetical protein
MSRLPLIVAVAVAVACGSSPRPAAQVAKPATPPPATAHRQAHAEPDPEADAADADDDATAMPMPGAPLEARIAAAQTTVKVISDGKGKKQVLRYVARGGARQALEIAIDFTGRQDTDEEVVPTIVLSGEAETRAVDKDGGADLVLTVSAVDVRPVAGAGSVDQYRPVLSKMAGLVIDGKRAANGATGEVTLRIPNPPSHARDALALIRQAMPTVPVLPGQPIGVGARWQATSALQIAGKLDVTEVTDYEVVAHDGQAWTIRGTTKVSGKDQDVDDARITAIGGAGASETRLTEGALYPVHKESLEIQFHASDTEKSTLFVLKLAGTITPR